ncbi:MAG TPA: hypothetical protein VIJ70_04130, partial [Gaiellaceae bacterium]
MRLVVLAAVALGVLAASASAGPPVRGPYALATLPSVGSVTWSCTAGNPGLRMRHRITFAASPRDATDEVTFRIGKAALVRRTVQPGRRLELPWTRAARMTLEVAQQTEARRLVAVVTIDFARPERASGSCWPYFPPAFVTRLAYG